MATKLFNRLTKWWYVDVDNWLWDKYNTRCNKSRFEFRLWFELTGQGKGARRYMKVVGMRRWWETEKRARKRRYGDLAKGDLKRNILSAIDQSKERQ